MAQIKKDNSKEMTSLFPDLKPGDRIYKVIKTYIFPDLEQMGFKMTKSPLTINRTIGDFEQQISFQKNKWNGGKVVVAFSPSFSVNLTTYEKWHIDRYGTMPLNTTIGFNRAEYIQKWGKKYFNDGWYDLAKIDNTQIVKTLKANILKSGLPYLNALSDLKGAIAYTMGQNSYYYKTPMLFDFALMLNEKRQAEEILNWFNNFKESSGRIFGEDTLREVEIRQQLFNIWA